MKPGIRVLGIDDASFNFEDEATFLTGVVYRGTEFIEDIVSTEIEVDGEDATARVIELYDQVQNSKQLKAIMVDGISFAGFNLVDIEHVNEETGEPVIAVSATEPDREDFRNTMERTGNFDENFENLEDAKRIELKDGVAYIQFAGISFEDAEQIVKNSTIHGLTPEPIRVAHMIGRSFDHIEKEGYS